jgi:hypothetical protein
MKIIDNIIEQGYRMTSKQKAKLELYKTEGGKMFYHSKN